jgi:hypothetical protein
MRVNNALVLAVNISLIILGKVQSFAVRSLPPSSKPLLYAATEEEDNGGDEELGMVKRETPSSDLIRPLAGGPSLIFAMAQRLNLWDDILNDSSEQLRSSTNKASSSYSASLPRFRQSSQQGISNVNPNFRTTSPVMNKKGYASSIIRNARKKKKPGLWRYSLRTYQKLKNIELMNHKKDYNDCDIVSSEIDSSTTSTNSGNSSKSSLMIYRENEHFQGVLVAVAKLGLWQEALNIYNELQELIDLQSVNKSNGSIDGSSPIKRRKDLKVNHSMIVSVIDACVRGMKLWWVIYAIYMYVFFYILFML